MSLVPSSALKTLSGARSLINSRFAGRDATDVVLVTLLASATLITTRNIYKYVKKRGLKRLVTSTVLWLASKIPSINAEIQQKKQATLDKLEEKVVDKATLSYARHLRLPSTGMSSGSLLAMLKEWSSLETSRWNRGQVSGGIYHGGEDLLALSTQVYSLFALTNPLHPDVFPFVRKMEAEVVSIILNLFNATDKAGGAMTGGGTESILMALKAYRDRAYTERGISEPELIIPATAHAAFDKGCHYFGIKLIKVPVNPKTFKADVAKIRSEITSNTIAIVGSAPCFPHGVIDDISELSQLAVKYKIGLHVDCCLGSLLVAYLEKLGYNPPLFDFRLPGVSSISCDTHKYGFSPKGSSVIMYNSVALRQYMYFVASDWTGGIYASPSMPGSRPGGLIAATWATMIHLGDDGYTNIFRDIMKAATLIRDGISRLPGLSLCGSPSMSIIAFETSNNKTSDDAKEVFKIAEAMGRRHWNLNSLQRPPAVHICVTYTHVNAVNKFLTDLEWAIKDIKENSHTYRDGTAAIYGMAESIPDPSLVEDITKGFLDAVLKA